ncbi:MAG: OmpH family outer membrane protein [Bacteroidetes bacterium]|nr:OmpH family outer membrane protein [Bacteroidota bacterium]
MKNITLLAAAIFTFIAIGANAQKFAYVDTEYILDQMPEYRGAQKQLNDLAKDWETEIVKMKSEIETLYKDYRAERLILSEENRVQREKEITEREKKLNEFKKDKFGPGGELEKKREQLLKPIQDKVFDAIQELAKDNALDFVFDKAGSTTMLFTNPNYDRSDEVLEYLGVAAGTSGTGDE